MSQPQIDLERLLKLRLVVARFGEMDGAKWWNTNGVLGKKGATLLSRGFPKTHRFAQARVVFAVAQARSAERWAGKPGHATLWDLPAELEDEFDSRWAGWLEDGSWAEFFAKIEEAGSELLQTLEGLDLLDADVKEAVAKMRRSAEGRAVALSGSRKLNDKTITLLAAGFARGETGAPAIPHVKVKA